MMMMRKRAGGPSDDETADMMREELLNNSNDRRKGPSPAQIFQQHRIPILTGMTLLAVFCFSYSTVLFSFPPPRKQQQEATAQQSDSLLLRSSTSSSNAEQQRRHYQSKARKCDPIEISDLKKREILTSQKAEDIHLLDWFNGLCGGTYIEMGALTGKDFSNTYVFNQAFGWKGLMIEPSPFNFERLKKNRPNDLALVNAAVCSHSRLIHFYEKKGLGAVNGIWEFASPSFRETAWKGATIADTKEVQCLPLMDIIEDNLGHADEHFFDIYSLDIEGAEIEALRSLDFDRVAFGVLLVENQIFNMRKHWAVRTLLASKGYIYLERIGGNDWFINERFHEIYKDLE